MDTLAGDRVEIDRQGRDQRLAFAGTHFRNLALMQHHPAEHLDVVMALAECALGAFADGREGFDQHVVQSFAVREALFEIFGARTQLVVGQFFDVRFQRIDLADHCL